MDNLLLEVDEAMRWERVEKFWKKYSVHVIAFLALIVLLTAGMEIYRAWRDDARMKNTEALLTLLQDEKFPDNAQAQAGEMRGPLKSMALLIAAAEFMHNDKPKEALALFDQAAKDGSAAPDLRGLALLMRARLLSSDPENKENLTASLDPVLKDRKSPWRPYALMEAASLAANHDGDFTKARAYLKRILDEEGLPDGVYAKAHALDQVYAQKEPKTPGEKKSGRDS